VWLVALGLCACVKQSMRSYQCSAVIVAFSITNLTCGNPTRGCHSTCILIDRPEAARDHCLNHAGTRTDRQPGVATGCPGCPSVPAGTAICRPCPRLLCGKTPHTCHTCRTSLPPNPTPHPAPCWPLRQAPPTLLPLLIPYPRTPGSFSVHTLSRIRIHPTTTAARTHTTSQTTQTRKPTYT